MLGIKILIGAIAAGLLHKKLTIDGDRLGLLVGVLLGLIEGENVGETDGLFDGDRLGVFSTLKEEVVRNTY